MTKILMLCVFMTACATDAPKEQTRQQGLCTVDDPDCGPPGTDPVLGLVNATTYDNYAADPGIDDGSDRISCWLGGGGTYHCNITASFGGFTYSAGCTFYYRMDSSCGCNVITNWSCEPGILR